MAEVTLPTADEAIEKAVEETPKEEKKTSDEKTEVKENEEEEEIDPLALREAQNIARLLKDPEQSVEFVRYLAKQAGLLKTEEQVSTKEAVKTTVNILREELGDEYGFLADKFAPAIEKIMRGAIEKEVGSVRETILEREKQEVRNEFDRSWDKVDEEFDGFLSVEKNAQKVNALMEEMPYKPGVSIEVYLRRLTRLAQDDNGTVKKSSSDIARKTVERITRNAREAKIASSDVDESKVQEGSEHPTIDEAIERAMKKLAKG